MRSAVFQTLFTLFVISLAWYLINPHLAHPKSLGTLVLGLAVAGLASFFQRMKRHETAMAEKEEAVKHQEK